MSTFTLYCIKLLTYLIHDKYNNTRVQMGILNSEPGNAITEPNKNKHLIRTVNVWNGIGHEC